MKPVYQTSNVQRRYTVMKPVYSTQMVTQPYTVRQAGDHRLRGRPRVRSLRDPVHHRARPDRRASSEGPGRRLRV